MDSREKELIYRLSREGRLSETEYTELIRDRDEEAATLLTELAAEKRKAVFGDVVYTRGLI